MSRSVQKHTNVSITDDCIKDSQMEKIAKINSHKFFTKYLFYYFRNRNFNLQHVWQSQYYW